MTAPPAVVLVNWACRRRLFVLVAAAAMLVASLVYIVGHFAMTADTAVLIAPTVEWRQQEIVIDRAFPQRGDSTLVVIDGATPELAETAAATLAARLSADHAHFIGVTRPDGGDFLAHEGLLFASPTEVQASTGRMVAAQPFLGPLAADPSLRGVATTLPTMLDGGERGVAHREASARPMRLLRAD